jgi:uncharacterized protein DUF6665
VQAPQGLRSAAATLFNPTFLPGSLVVSPRKPTEIGFSSRPESGASALERALKGESAANLGRLGRAVQAALVALRSAPAPERESLEYACAEAVWQYFVQREVCGLVRHDAVIEAYAIPAPVLAKVGVRRSSSSDR